MWSVHMLLFVQTHPCQESATQLIFVLFYSSDQWLTTWGWLCLHREQLAISVDNPGWGRQVPAPLSEQRSGACYQAQDCSLDRVPRPRTSVGLPLGNLWVDWGSAPGPQQTLQQNTEQAWPLKNTMKKFYLFFIASFIPEPYSSKNYTSPLSGLLSHWSSGASGQRTCWCCCPLSAGHLLLPSSSLARCQPNRPSSACPLSLQKSREQSDKYSKLKNTESGTFLPDEFTVWILY